MGNKICVLHVVGTRPIGGIGSLLKNINKVIDLESFAFIYAFLLVNSQETLINK